MVDLTGSTTYDIGAYTYQQECTPNQLAVDISALMDALASTNKLNSATAVSIGSGSDYAPLSTAQIKNLASSGGSTLNWLYASGATPPTFFIYETGSPRLEIQITSTDPVSFNLTTSLGNVKSFSQIKYTGTNTFEMIGLDVTGAYLVTLKCNMNRFISPGPATPVTMGTCALPQPEWCEGPAYNNLPALTNLIADALNKSTYPPMAILDLYESTAMTPDILAQLPAGTTSTTSISTSTQVGGVYFDTVKINIANGCPIILSKSFAGPYTIYQLPIQVYSYHPTGETDELGNYHSFYIIAKFGGVFTAGHVDTIFVQSCFPVNLCGSAPEVIDTEADFPNGEFEDPCTDYLTGIAYANALNAYNNYQDSLRAYISEKYVKHCMNAFEKFTRSYTDNEYHRTLYYYDQAGNLVKTVPPEGIELLSMTSDTDPLALSVKADRTNGTHTVLTSHRLATTYEYNSLNQLVRQFTPDQDPLDVWQITLPNGLQAGLNTTAIQMINSNIGYLTGWVSISSRVRGFLYRTDNGGSNWVKVNNTVASNLKKIQMVDASIGYAVGTFGVALKTVDGGTTWDMLNTYANSITADLNDLYFSSTTVGRFVGKNGVEMVTANGGTSFTVSTTALPAGVVAGSTINEIRTVEPFGATFLYTVSISSSGAVYDVIAEGTSTAALTVRPVQGPTYNAIHFYDGNNAVIAGADGNLVSAFVPTSGTAHVQTNRVSGITLPILRAYFMTAQRGIALVQEGSNKMLSYTIDGGLTWQAVVNALLSYNDLQLVSQSGTLIEAIATSTTGHTSRLIFTNTVVPHIIDHTNYLAAQNLDIVTAQVVTDGTSRRIIAGTADGKIYRSGLLGNGNEPVTYTLIGTLASGSAKKILLSYFSANGTISGIIQTSTGKIYTIHRTGTAGSFALGASALGTGTSSFGDITLSGVTALAFDNTLKTVYRMVLNQTSATTSTMLSGAATGTPVANAIGINQGRLTFVGLNGEIHTTALTVLSGASVTWQVHSNLRMTPLQDLHFLSGNDVLAVGDNGTILKRVLHNGVYTFMVVPVGAVNDLKVAKTNGSACIVAGSKGYVSNFTFSSGVSTSLALNNGQATTAYFAGVDFNGAGVLGTNVYVAGTNGTVLYSQNTATQLFSFTSGTHQVDFNALSITPGQSGSFVKMYAVGANSKVYRFTGTSGVQVKQVFSDTLYDVHFANEGVGTIAGKGFFVRQTSDGGNTWKVVLPNTTAQLSKKINKTWTKPNGFAMLLGRAYFSTVTAGVSTQVATTAIFNDVQFPANSPNVGYVAVSNTIHKLSLAPLGLNSYTATFSAPYVNPGYTLNAIHVFENGGVMAAGTGGYVGYMKPGATTATAWVSMSPGVGANTYKDIFFHDDATGYLVGTNGTEGVIMRTTSVTYVNPVTYELGSLTWATKGYTGDGLVTSTANVTTINAIAFGSRYEGIWGGSYAAGFASQNTAYVRKIHDETNQFSTRFFYDRLGRLVVSQNARQYDVTPSLSKYSYSLYDPLGRVYEAGEKTENSSGTLFAGIFGTTVNDLYNPNVIDDTKLNAWITGNGARKEVTRSYYDAAVITGLPAGFTPDVRTQRKRITHVTYEATFDNNHQTFDHATHYDYDIHGNVKTLLQDNRKMSLADANLVPQRYKRMDYVYDLISGNVHRVSYQQGKADQWHHAYTYDADNRIVDVRTTATTPFIAQAYGNAVMYNETGSVYWDKDASYKYYDHGPLARTELGTERVQGIDYMYTLQGWLKGVNSTTLTPTRDPAQDGLTTGRAAADAFSFGLHYYHRDYATINNALNVTTSHPFALQGVSDDLMTNSVDLYNGNIARMVTTITNPTTRAVLPLGNAYRYDQLNRLSESRSFTTIHTGSNTWNAATTYNGMYENNFTYDKNGNIKYQNRKNESGTELDHLAYNYATNTSGKLINNRLYAVADAIASGSFADDIDNMTYINSNPNSGANNYKYDKEGRLIQDLQEQIASIEWRVDGKVLKINRTGGSAKKNLTFDYDAMGNRIAKHVLTSANVLEKSTYYVLDASGNTMSVYERTVNVAQQTVAFYQAEKHIYGSSRLGVLQEDIPLLGSQNSTYSMWSIKHRTGLRTYELSNHLGNVLSVISDKIIPHNNGAGVPDYYLADIRVAQDYSPFGVTLSGRNFTLAGAEKSRYGFQGQEMDEEVKGEGNSYDFGNRMYDDRLGRFLSLDRFSKKYPYISNYSFAANNPLNIVEIDGDSLYILVKGVPMNAYSVAGRKEFDKLGFNTLLNTTEGTVLLEKYANSSKHDVYVGIGPIAKEGVGAMTTNNHLRPEDKLNLTDPSMSAMFEGLKLKNKKVTYSLMLFNEDLSALKGEFSKELGFIDIDVPESFYHELKSHVDFAKYAYSKTSDGEKAGHIQHEKYGVKHNESCGINKYYKIKSEDSKTPYSVIVSQLQTASRNGVKPDKKLKPKEPKVKK